MSLVNARFQVNELAKIDSVNGFTIAQFPQIRDAVARKMMEIYGNDIDLSSASADGQFINMEAMILNNIYRTLYIMQTNEMPSTASGRYLDVIGGLKGFTRFGSSYSTAYVWVKYIGNVANYSPTFIRLLDKNGNTWTWINPIDIEGNKQVTFNNTEGNKVSLLFKCDNIGVVKANGTGVATENIDFDASNVGDIYTTSDLSDFKVYQQKSAFLGTLPETDASFRNRIIGGFNNEGLTTIGAIQQALKRVVGVKDVFVVSNNSASSVTLPDSTSLSPHNVYIAIALEKGANLTAETIGQIIYKQITPGVITQGITAGTTQACYNIPSPLTGSWIDQSYNIKVTSTLSSTVRWKACSPLQIKLQGVITNFDASSDITRYTTDIQNTIRDNLRTHLEGVGINGVISASKLKTIIENSIRDLGYVNSCQMKLGNTVLSENYLLPLSLIQYSNPGFSVSYANSRVEFVFDELVGG